MKPVKLGIIGCGIAAKDLHWPALRQMMDKFEIVCVCNHTEPKAKKFAQLVGKAQYVLDYKEMLANPKIEAVDIVLPIHLNYQVVKDSLDAGKHVLVEKPLAGNMEQAREMLKFKDQYSKVMLLAENVRYRPSTFKIKTYLESGIIGKPYATFWDMFHCITQENAFMKTRWRIDHKHIGGVISDGGVHFIAGIRSILGDITELKSFVKSVNPDIGKVDSLTMQFRTADDVCGNLNLYYSAIGICENKLRILGNKGTLTLIDNLIEIKTKEEEHSETIDEDFGVYEEFENFFNAIRKNQPVLSSFYEGYMDVEAIMVAVENRERVL